MSTIADLIVARLTPLDIVDKIAGVVRAIPRSFNTSDKKKATKVFPVACNVIDPLNCPESQYGDLVPDGRYRSIIYFEDQGTTRNRNRIAGAIGYTSKLRLVAWMNTGKIGPACTTGEAFRLEIEQAIQGPAYNSGYLGIRHKVTGVQPKANNIFARYTYNELQVPYLHWPFDYFALDIETTYLVPDGCLEPIIPTPIACTP